MNQITDSFFPNRQPGTLADIIHGSNQYILKLRRIILLRYFVINANDSVELKTDKVFLHAYTEGTFQKFFFACCVDGG
jgi:hypothetical protein